MSTGTPDVPVGRTNLRLEPDVPERGDAELLAASRTGDQEAYGELFRRHAPAATALARRLTGNSTDADDLVSEAFTKVLAALKNGNGPTSALRPYLLTAVRRVHVDRAVAGQRVQPTDDIGAHDPGVPFIDPAVAGLERSMVAQAYQQLPERWQMVLWHTEVEELSPKDIAPLLGMSPNAVAALALRARAGLREAYLAAHVTRTSSPECERMLPKLAAYVRGSAGARERAAVERHLPDCEECRAALVELQDVGGRMRAVVAPLVLGVFASGYLADVALLPAIGNSLAAGTLATAGAAAAGSATSVGSGAGAGGAGGGSAGAAAASSSVGGWVVAGASTLIVVGAIAGAIALAGHGPVAASRTSSGTTAEGQAGAGSQQSAITSAPETMPQSPLGQPLGPAVTTSRSGLTATAVVPMTSRTESPSVTPTTASPAPTPSETTPIVIVPTTPAPTIPPKPTLTTPPPVAPTTPPPTTEPTTPPPVVIPAAPELKPVVGGDIAAGNGSGNLSFALAPAASQPLTVTITLPAQLTSPGGDKCVVSADGHTATCTVDAGDTALALPVTAAPVTTNTDVSVLVSVSGTGLTSTETTTTLTLKPVPAPSLTPTLSGDVTAGTGSLDFALTPAPTQPLTVTITLPDPLTSPGSDTCTMSPDAHTATCQVATGDTALAVPLTATPITSPTPVSIVVSVSGTGLAPTESTTQLTLQPPLTATDGFLTQTASASGHVTSAVAGGSWVSAATSSSVLHPASSSIRYARLYWAGQTTGGPSSASMQLTDPAGTAHTVAAERTQPMPLTNDRAVHGWQPSFLSSADVSALVATHANGLWTGAPTGQFNGRKADFAGWVLMMVADDPTAADQQITLFDGAAVVGPAHGFTTYTTPLAEGAATTSVLAWGTDGPLRETIRVGNTTLSSDGLNGTGVDRTTPDQRLDVLPLNTAGSTRPLTFTSISDRFGVAALLTSRPL